MRTKNFYNFKTGITKNEHGLKALRVLFIGVLLFCCKPVKAQTYPAFINGNPQYDTVCTGITTNITSLLAINDTGTSNTITWNIIDSPSNGTLAGFPYSATSNGGTVTPAGLTYMADSGSADTFTVQVDDGNGDTAYTTVYVTINPTPALAAPGNQSVCNGSNDTVIFNGNTTGETYTWTNNNTSIGLPGSGSGDTLSFAGTDTSAMTPALAIVMVTPSANGCMGAMQTFTITVNPIPAVNADTNQMVCAGSLDSVMFTGTPGTTFSWTNSNTGIGLGANGTGNIAPFTAINSTNAIENAMITVTPSIGGCMGAVQSFTITVNPTPYLIDSPTSQTQCNGFPTDTLYFSDAVDGATFSWMNSNVNIGLPASGTSPADSAYILPFTASDTSTAAIMGIVTVTPMANGCMGPVQSFTITVNPTPLLISTVSRYVICDSTDFFDSLSSATTGVYFSWTRASVPGLSNPAGSGGFEINDTLVNTTADTVVATYVITLAANGCTNTQNINVTVSPRPMLTSGLTIPQICSGGMVSYSPASATSPIYFSWVRDSVAGISPGSNVGSPNISETLTNTSANPVVVTYIYTLDAYSCTNTQDVTVTVNPIPALTNNLTPAAICDSTLFSDTLRSATNGVSFTWMRDSVAGILPSTGSGDSIINEVLVNTTSIPLAVTYNVALSLPSAPACADTQSITVYVNTRPTLITSLTPATICDSTLFTYAPFSSTPGFNPDSTTWYRDSVGGISNPTAFGTGTINEVLVNTTDSQVVVTYIDTLNVNGCMNVQSITDTVNPKPMLTSADTANAICNKQVVNYIPMSHDSGTTFTWVRPYMAGILEPMATSSGNPNEQLINTTNFAIVDTYIYTIMYEGCRNVEKVSVDVLPTPILSSDTIETICSGIPFIYGPTSYTPLTTFTWTRSAVSGLSPASASGTDSIHETLTDSLGIPLSTMYKYILNIDGCTNTQNVELTVNPSPPTVAITLMPAHALCSGTYFQNFGASIPPAAGVSYRWSAVNATVYAEGDTKQYALVNFGAAGNAAVTLTTTSASTECANNSATYAVTVSNSISDDPQVIYYNGQFICLMNSEASYQWGYDDALSLAPTTLSGQVNQIYFNNGPDFTHYNYWVETSSDSGCTQKSYYNAPLGVTNVNQAGTADIKVYPNPAVDEINIEINTSIDGDVAVEILNILGQKLASAAITGHSATMNVASLPAGCYLIDCYRDGVKLTTAKFIKN